MLQRLAEQRPADLRHRVSADLPSIDRALDFLVSTGDVAALELACRMDSPLYVLGWWREKGDLLERALAVPGPPSPMRARALAYRARAGPLHLFDAAHAEHAEAMAAEVGHELLLAYARTIRAIGLWWSGDHDLAMELAQHAVSRFDAASRVPEASEARKFLGLALVFAGDVERGIAVQHEGIVALRRTEQQSFLVAHALALLGHCHRMLGDDRSAAADLLEARELCRQFGNQATAIHVDVGLADLAVDGGDPESALERIADAVALTRDDRGSVYEAWAWTVALRAHTALGDHESATATAQRAVDVLPLVPPGETVRLAIELAHAALIRGDRSTAARLVGVVRGTDDVRELPFRPPAERARLVAVERELERVGVDIPKGAGALSISEAIGPATA
jgi:tetratricopeptide (TPR) repeat protein